MLANQRFAKLLKELADQDYIDPLSAQEMLAFHEEQVNELGGSLEESIDSEKESELISSQEFEFLLMEENSEE